MRRHRATALVMALVLCLATGTVVVATDLDAVSVDDSGASIGDIVAEDLPIVDARDTTVVDNFKYCGLPVHECFAELQGVAFITPVYYTAPETSEEARLALKSGHFAGDNQGTKKRDLRRVQLLIGNGETFKKYTIRELPPEPHDLTSRPVYFVTGLPTTYDSLALAIKACAEKQRLSMSQIYFPIYECGGQYADATNMQSAALREAIASDHHGEDDGHELYKAGKNCLWGVHKAGGVCAAEYYKSLGQDTAIFRPSSGRPYSWTMSGPANSKLLRYHKAGRKAWEVYGYHMATPGRSEISEFELSPRIKKTDDAAARVYFDKLQPSLKNPFFKFQDFYCGGEYWMSTLDKLKPASVERMASAIEAGEAVGARFIPAMYRTLTNVVPLPVEKEVTDESSHVPSAVAGKCSKWYNERGIEVVTGQDLGITFDDVAGNDVGKKALYDNIITPFLLNSPKNSRNVLQYGPPGTGKSLLAKALVGQLNKAAEMRGTGKMVTYIPITTSNLEEKWHGKSEENVRTLFDCARAYSPSVIFFDEVDGLFARRTDRTHENQVKVKSEFLVQLDGSFNSKDDELVVFIGATNRPMDLDSAFRRRLPVGCFVGMPTAAARKAILGMHLRRYFPKGYTESEWWHPLIAATAGYSGSDLVNLAKEATVMAQEQAMTSSRTASLPARILETLAGDAEMAASVKEMGILAILQANKPGSPYEMSEDEVREFVKKSQDAVETNTMVATGPQLEDALLLRRAMAKIKRSVTESEMLELYKYMMTLGGEQATEVPQFYYRRLGYSMRRAKKTEDDPFQRDTDIYDYVVSE